MVSYSTDVPWENFAMLAKFYPNRLRTILQPYTSMHLNSLEDIEELRRIQMKLENDVTSDHLNTLSVLATQLSSPESIEMIEMIVRVGVDPSVPVSFYNYRSPENHAQAAGNIEALRKMDCYEPPTYKLNESTAESQRQERLASLRKQPIRKN